MTERVLVLAESVSATQVISFGKPLAGAHGIGLEMVGDDPSFDAAEAREALFARVQPTVVVLSRYGNARALAFQALAHRSGLPTVFHIDDDLLDVPMALGKAKYDYYHQPERKATLRRAMDAADLVYASTGPLAKRLAEHGIRAPIVAGELYCSMDAQSLPTPLPATVPVVGYMGTGGHSQDLALVMPGIVRLMEAVPDLRFETFGTIKPPPEMAAFPGRYGHLPGVAQYDGFLDRLCSLGWWVGLAPLEDNAFNRCKADTKWVEYTYAGMPVVAARLPVYDAACAGGAGLQAGGPDDWHAALAALLADRGRRDAQLALARQRLQRQYHRRRLHDQVLDVLRRVRHDRRASVTA